MLAPSKFAVCFTIGSLLLMSAFLSLRGWKSQLSHMFSTERLPFSAGAQAACLRLPVRLLVAECLLCGHMLPFMAADDVSHNIHQSAHAT